MIGHLPQGGATLADEALRHVLYVGQAGRGLVDRLQRALADRERHYAVMELNDIELLVGDAAERQAAGATGQADQQIDRTGIDSMSLKLACSALPPGTIGLIATR